MDAPSPHEIWNWQFAFSVLPEILRGLPVTLQAVAGGMVFALIVGLVWAICRRSTNPLFSWPAAGFVEFIRSTPLLVQMLFLFYALPRLGITLGPLTAGILALGIHYSCYISEVYRAGINSIPRGQWEAAKSLNLTTWQTYRHVILPQAIPPVVPPLGNYLISMIKDAPMMYAITVLEILNRAMIVGKEEFRFVEPLTLVGVIFLLLALLLGFAVDWVERRLHVERV